MQSLFSRAIQLSFHSLTGSYSQHRRHLQGREIKVETAWAPALMATLVGGTLGTREETARAFLHCFVLKLTIL